MRSIDIVISNDRHHWAMTKPLIEAALARGHRCRVLSLCEFRGLITPSPAEVDSKVEILRLSRVQRPRRAKGQGSAGGTKLGSNLMRELAWRFSLAGGVKKALAAEPDVVVLFNDAAYPYDRLCRLLNTRRIPFLLVQEGIRYDVADTAQEGSLNQGKGGATAIAAWGESSAEYYMRQGAPPETICLTGNARFDRIDRSRFRMEASRIRKELDLRDRILLFLSNPVEFHGYCTAETKMALVRDFIAGIGPVLERGTSLLFKLHGHESAADFQAVADSSPFFDRIRLVEGEELYSLLHLADAAVIFSTTAGLEAMLLDVPLGVLEIPNVGFLHDYVKEGAATPLAWNRPMADQVEALLARKEVPDSAVERYLGRSLAVRSGAADRTLDLVEGVAGKKDLALLARQAVG